MVEIIPHAGVDASSLEEPDLRRFAAEVALGVSHLGMDVNPTAYSDFIFAFDRASYRYSAEAQALFSCALGGRGYLARMGCRDRHITIPYEHDNTHAVSDVLAACDGWVDATRRDVALPGLGDLVYIDNDDRTNPHIKIMAAWNEDDEALFAPSDRSVFTSVDGGQTLKDEHGRPLPGKGYRFEPKACFFDRLSPTRILCRSAIAPTAPARQLVGYGPITAYRFTAPIGAIEVSP